VKTNLFKGKGLLIFILIILLGLAIISLGSILVVNLVHRPDYGSEVRQYFDDGFLAKAADYSRVSLNISIASRFLAWLVMGGAILLFFKYFKNPRINILYAFLLIVLFYILIELILLPLSYYRGYVVEHRFGLSNQTISMWFMDYLKENIISLIITYLAMTGIYALMVYMPGHWWIVSSVVLAVFIIILSYLYPILIDPLFYNFKKLEDENLREQIVDIADKADIEVKDVMVADASRKTSKVNAYFAGVGRSRRVVVFDNLINNFSEQEALSVVAHEIGHWYNRHIIKNMIIGAVSGTLGLFLLHLIFSRSGMLGDFRSILVIILLISVVSFLMMPVGNAVSRFFERQADSFAVRATGNPDAQVNLMVKLGQSNLSSVSPAGYIRFFLYSHPPIMERIEAAKSFSKD
jgi:STE24 endopeptidase